MRIAVIGAHGGIAAHPGIREALGEIFPRLALRGHEIDVFSESNGRSIGDIDGTRTIRLPTLATVSSHALVSSLVSAVRGYDVVNFCSAEANGLFTMAAKLGLYRTVVSVHGLGRLPGQPGAPLLAPESMAARFADAITVVSRRLERHFRDAYGRDTFYIPNGIARRQSPPAAAVLASPGLVPDQYVLLAGRMRPEANIHLAVAAANAAGPACRLVVAETGDGEGDGDYRTHLRYQSAPGRVTFLGRVGPAALDALIAHAYLVLVPATAADEVPPVLLQALAHGRTVVVSDQPEHLDVIGGDGFTFTAGDAGDLKRVLVWLLNDREVVEQMRRRTQANVASQYCWDRIAEAYEMVFTSVL